ncbi:MAG: electron transporter SenC [Massilia sp.]|jgi:protein SCO1/2|nr:electron transporter SenC [Massilia sp.]
MDGKRKLVGALGRPGGNPRDAAYFGNARLLTHEGKGVRFYDDLLSGKLVVINMMYTTCTGICPANTAALKALQQALGARVGRDIFMYSLSLRPAFDTPAALRDYARRYDTGPGWTFLTGKPMDVDAIRRRLGFYDSNPAVDADPARHTGMLRIGNLRASRWCMAPALASTRQLVATIEGAA